MFDDRIWVNMELSQILARKYKRASSSNWYYRVQSNIIPPEGETFHLTNFIASLQGLYKLVYHLTRETNFTFLAQFLQKFDHCVHGQLAMITFLKREYHG